MYTRSLRLFYSYAHEDQRLQEEVKKYLRMLEREGLIQGWDDRMIGAGTEWEGQILEALERADVVLLLISADFLSSDYCWDVEMARALMRHNAREALVVPIILRPCPWQGAPFAKLQCLPRDAIPVVSWKPTDEGYLNVAEGLREALKERASHQVERPDTKQVHVHRALDGAIAKAVPVDRATDVVAMVRRLDSRGLRAVLETESGYSAAPDDVLCNHFDLYFPSTESGDLESAKVTLRLEGVDFEPPQQEKTIEVPPEADSLTCVFLVRALREGPLVMSLEVRQYAVTLAQQLLRTTGDRDVPRRTLRPYSIASVGYIHPAEGGSIYLEAGSAPFSSGHDSEQMSPSWPESYSSGHVSEHMSRSRGKSSSRLALEVATTLGIFAILARLLYLVLHG